MTDSNEITARGFREALRRAGKNNLDAKKIIDEVDITNKGSIDFEQFKHLITI